MCKIGYCVGFCLYIPKTCGKVAEKRGESPMPEYQAARNRTRSKIERAFWELYLEKNFRRVTVREITERAKIHRSTFYTYYDTVGDIFDSIKEHQLALLREVIAIRDTRENEFQSLLEALQQLYEQNRMFLKPLLVDYHSSSFSRAYRQILKEGLKREGGFPRYPEGSREFFVLDCVMSAYIELLLQCLDSRELTMLETYRLAYSMMTLGTEPTLEKQFGIKPTGHRSAHSARNQTSL